ncbi:MAG: phosphatase PAP2 family protein [Rikenellaceae bacterium]
METILALDQQLLLALNFPGGNFLDSFFFMVSGKLIWLPLYLFIACLLVIHLGWRKALIALVCMGLMVVAVDHVANFFKSYTPKFRPSRNPALAPFVHTVNGYKGGLYGTVSAHAAISFTIAFTSLSLIRNKIYTILILVWALLVSYSRIYLGVHFPLDIFFGISSGCLFSFLALKLYYLTTKRLKL